MATKKPNKDISTWIVIGIICLAVVTVCLALFIPRAPAPVSQPANTQADYIPKAQEQIDATEEGLAYLSELLQSPDFDNETWVKAVLVWAEVIKKAHNNLAAMLPPSELIGFHSDLLDGTKNCDTAMDHLINGIKDQSPDKLRAVSRPLERCGRVLEQSTQELDQLR